MIELAVFVALCGAVMVGLTLAAYPLVPREEVGFRIQITARNTDDEIDRLNDVLTSVAERFPARRTAAVGGPP